MDDLDLKIQQVLREHSRLYEETRPLLEKANSQRLTEVDIEKLEELENKFDEFYGLLRQKYPDLPEA